MVITLSIWRKPWSPWTLKSLRRSLAGKGSNLLRYFPSDFVSKFWMTLIAGNFENHVSNHKIFLKRICWCYVMLWCYVIWRYKWVNPWLYEWSIYIDGVCRIIGLLEWENCHVGEQEVIQSSDVCEFTCILNLCSPYVKYLLKLLLDLLLLDVWEALPYRCQACISHFNYLSMFMSSINIIMVLWSVKCVGP